MLVFSAERAGLSVNVPRRIARDILERNLEDRREQFCRSLPFIAFRVFLRAFSTEPIITSRRPHLDAAKGVGGLGEILVDADEGLTAFRLGQMQTIRKVHALPHRAQRLRRGSSIFQTPARNRRGPWRTGQRKTDRRSAAPTRSPAGLWCRRRRHCCRSACAPWQLVRYRRPPDSGRADDKISIDCEHAAVSPRRRSPLPYP